MLKIVTFIAGAISKSVRALNDLYNYLYYLTINN
jgi:hypothetical protein